MMEEKVFRAEAKAVVDFLMQCAPSSLSHILAAGIGAELVERSLAICRRCRSHHLFISREQMQESALCLCAALYECQPHLWRSLKDFCSRPRHSVTNMTGGDTLEFVKHAVVRLCDAERFIQRCVVALRIMPVRVDDAVEVTTPNAAVPSVRHNPLSLSSPGARLLSPIECEGLLVNLAATLGVLWQRTSNAAAASHERQYLVEPSHASASVSFGGAPAHWDRDEVASDGGQSESSPPVPSRREAHVDHVAGTEEVRGSLAEHPSAAVHDRRAGASPNGGGDGWESQDGRYHTWGRHVSKAKATCKEAMVLALSHALISPLSTFRGRVARGLLCWVRRPSPVAPPAVPAVPFGISDATLFPAFRNLTWRPATAVAGHRRGPLEGAATNLYELSSTREEDEDEECLAPLCDGVDVASALLTQHSIWLRLHVCAVWLLLSHAVRGYLRRSQSWEGAEGGDTEARQLPKQLLERFHACTTQFCHETLSVALRAPRSEAQSPEGMQKIARGRKRDWASTVPEDAPPRGDDALWASAASVMASAPMTRCVLCGEVRLPHGMRFKWSLGSKAARGGTATREHPRCFYAKLREEERCWVEGTGLHADEAPTFLDDLSFGSGAGEGLWSSLREDHRRRDLPQSLLSEQHFTAALKTVSRRLLHCSRLVNGTRRNACTCCEGGPCGPSHQDAQSDPLDWRGDPTLRGEARQGRGHGSSGTAAVGPSRDSCPACHCEACDAVRRASLGDVAALVLRDVFVGRAVASSWSNLSTSYDPQAPPLETASTSLWEDAVRDAMGELHGTLQLSRRSPSLTRCVSPSEAVPSSRLVPPIRARDGLVECGGCYAPIHTRCALPLAEGSGTYVCSLRCATAAAATATSTWPVLTVTQEQ